ncbi:MAG: phosphoenolpyruvate synthase [Hydrogenophilaceae bacterium]|nr:phosphoenolpyruvate synthase [Hydrogenophilaceae bacterium]
MPESNYIAPLETLSMQDVPRVGGKNASLGEMIGALSGLGVKVPGGFATTAEAFWSTLDHNGLREKIHARLAGLDVSDVAALQAAGQDIRTWVEKATLPAALEQGIRNAYEAMGDHVSVAVRSSATAEDLPDASFAGQQETYLNVRGADDVVSHVKKVFASLYNDRAIAYRVHHGFDHAQVALSAGIQRMVRSDLAASGVIFTLDTESGFREVVFITSSYGLGEMVVQGAVNPDEFYVHKPTRALISKTLGSKAIKLVYGAEGTQGAGTKQVATPEDDRLRFSITDADVRALADMAMTIERHYRRPMDIEWAKDGETGELFIVQARPETVKARSTGLQEKYVLKGTGEVRVTGRAIGQKIGAGRVCVVASPKEMERVQPGDVLVADMTDPDWEPVMKRSAAIITNRGGRTCHAAIVARELGIPAVVGSGNATEVLTAGEEVTVSCAEGDTGKVYAGRLEFDRIEEAESLLPEPPVKIMMNVANPERAFEFAQIPNHGVGLARIEFIINNQIGIHPLAALEISRFASLATPESPGSQARHPLYQGSTDVAPLDKGGVGGILSDEFIAQILAKTAGYADPVAFYVDKLAEGVATLAASFWPKPVIVRMSDFKSNEYAHLLGGKTYEPEEENPMIGFRGASRYVSSVFRPAFELECRALKKVRDDMGLTNVEIMIPFVRTLEEARGVVELLAENGLKRGEGGLRLIMMCEIPSNVLLAEEFLKLFDGFSIGSNDLTQLTLGVDRDSALVAGSFDERNPAVKKLLAEVIAICKRQGKYIGICGQGPSDHPDFAEWLVGQGIESISLNPDTVVATWKRLASFGRATPGFLPDEK